MPNQLNIYIDKPPPTSTAQGSNQIMRRGGKTFIGKKKSSLGSLAECWWIENLYPHRPAEPLQGPLLLAYTIRFAWPKSTPKKDRVNGWAWTDLRPDMDNLEKLFFDCMRKCGYYHDDSQIAARGAGGKMWHDIPGVVIHLREIGRCEVVNPGYEINPNHEDIP